jgi:ABC-type enterochelin transport system substrate-binding protein
MKKFFGILAIAVALTACNNESGTTEGRKDSIDSAAAAAKDTVEAKSDATKEAIDSSAKMEKAVVDSAAKIGDSTHK